jgi:hypothetical protein
MNKSSQPLKRVAIKPIEGHDRPAEDGHPSPPPGRVRLFANFHTSLAGILIFILGALVIEGYSGSLFSKLTSLPTGKDHKNPILNLTFTDKNSAGLHLVPGPKRGTYGVAFNGAGDYLELNSPVTIPSQNGTIIWWMRRNEHRYENIFGYFKNGGRGQIDIDGFPSQDQNNLRANVIRVESITNNKWVQSFDTGIDTADGGWHQYALVFQPDKVLLYVDGRLADQKPPNSDRLAIRFIGHQQNQKDGNFYGDWFKGEIANMSIYNQGLKETEVASLRYGVPAFFFTKIFKYIILFILSLSPLAFTKLRQRFRS